MFGKSGSKWKAEYDDTLYKIYDWDGNLAGYLFPQYGDIEPKEQEDEIIDELNKTHSEVPEATLLLPMVKLDLLDKQEGLDIDYVILSLEANAERTIVWKKWLHDNAKSFKIVGAAVYTAREDRNMLSIALGIVTTIRLGEKEVRDFLSPLLDKLHEDGLL
ncbi:hypothetical protein Ngar_c21130 [Candidatus Nitrososphaera gargensis Ga9.2]|uniref:Uncharacterized protein n=1 Tax=Nitrososphaera gargensis (strain Ga9.2) TaxID=1237085 RepID=K0INA7_NITGG|nr:hypothetical protein [Candidatus Nitrososphaera gargensis]AFU59044.1 hypothetical protein Ngar_c21130 [Candidatus Nitrososphaera gargensis Ga9.2]